MEQVVQITITSYATESLDDNIYIYDGSSTSSLLLASLSGVSYTGSTYRSSQAYMYVLFSSDSSITYGGFTATFQSTNGEYKHKLLASTLTVLF